MSSVAVKSDDRNSRSPTNAEQSQKAYVRDGDDSPDNELSPELIMVNSRKESHRASERKRRERLSMSMSTLEGIIRQTRKFANKKSLKLDKNSVIEHTIAYIRELQNVNLMYSKRLEEANQQIQHLQAMVGKYPPSNVTVVPPAQQMAYSTSSQAGALPPFPPVPFSGYPQIPVPVNTNPYQPWPISMQKPNPHANLSSLLQAAQEMQKSTK